MSDLPRNYPQNQLLVVLQTRTRYSVKDNFVWEYIYAAELAG